MAPPPDVSGTFSLLVLNISFRTTPQELRAEFERFGTLADVYIPRGNRGTSRGYAFVRYYDKQDAEAARVEMDKKMLDNREIGVQIAQREKDRRPRSPRNFRSRSPPFRGGYGRGRGGGPAWRDYPPRRYEPRGGFDDGPRRDRRNFDHSPPPGSSSSRRFSESRSFDDGPSSSSRRDSRRPRDNSPTPGLSPERKRPRADFPEDPREFRRDSDGERNRSFDRQTEREERFRGDDRRNRGFRESDDRSDRFSRDNRDNRFRGERDDRFARRDNDERDRFGRRDNDERVKDGGRGHRFAGGDRDERFHEERNNRFDGGGRDDRSERFESGERDDHPRFKNRERSDRRDRAEEPSQVVSDPVSTAQTARDSEEDGYRRRD